MTVLEQFEFRIITEKKSSDNLPISLQLLLSASDTTITCFRRIATDSFAIVSGGCRTGHILILPLDQDSA